MRKLVFPSLFIAAFLPLTATAAARCNWEATARPLDVARVTTDVVELERGLSPRGSRDATGIATAQSLLRRAQKPLALGRITGNWRVRSIQVDPGFAYAYPWFRATITDPPGCGLHFAKTSGSQRRTGTMFPLVGNARALAFLGASTVNNDPMRDYDLTSDSNFNSAGRLVRIGRNELLLILDAGSGRFELYHLRK